ncbi:MAG: hypothetical protein ACTH2Q_07385 [Propionibacteriaceae bacterium]
MTTAKGRTIEGAADQLYAVPPAEFVAQRSALAKEVKAAGEKELAAQIGTLRKPTKSAWVVNLLARDAADELQELLDLGQALAEATRALSGPDLRRLSTQRNAAVDSLTRRAVALATDHDHLVSEAQRTEVAQTLQAALADPNVAHVVRSGLLTQATQYGGFGPLDVIGAVAPGRIPTPTGPGTAKAPKGRGKDAAADREAARKSAEATLRAATATASEATDAADRATRDAESAADRADELLMQVAQLQSRLAEAEAEAEAARAALADATDRRDRARIDAEAATKSVDSAEATVRDLD